MTRDNPQDEPADESEGLGDPWAAFGYLVAGVAFYGLLGWGLSAWLHAIWLIPVGILVGAALGLYMVYARLGKIPKPTGGSSPTTPRNFRATRICRATQYHPAGRSAPIVTVMTEETPSDPG